MKSIISCVFLLLAIASLNAEEQGLQKYRSKAEYKQLIANYALGLNKNESKYIHLASAAPLQDRFYPYAKKLLIVANDKETIQLLTEWNKVLLDDDGMHNMSNYLASANWFHTLSKDLEGLKYVYGVFQKLIELTKSENQEVKVLALETLNMCSANFKTSYQTAEWMQTDLFKHPSFQPLLVAATEDQFLLKLPGKSEDIKTSK